MREMISKEEYLRKREELDNILTDAMSRNDMNADAMEMIIESVFNRQRELDAAYAKSNN